MRLRRLMFCHEQRKNDKGAERASGLVWVEEAVDRGRSIAQPIEQAHRHQPAIPVAKLGKACVDIAGLNHVTIFLLGHPRLPANAMARVDRKSTRLNSSHKCATRMPAHARKKTEQHKSTDQTVMRISQAV